MLKTVLKILLVSLAGLLVTSIFTWMVSKGHQQYFRHSLAQVEEIYNDKDFYDILYIGSSRTHTTINPAIVDSVTGLRSYNAGVEGGNLYEFKMSFDGWLQSHPQPRLVVLTLDANSFDIRKKMFAPLKYFNSIRNPVIKSSFRQDGNYSYFLLRYLPFMKIIYFDDYTTGLSLRGLAGQNEMDELKAFEYNGFLSNGDKCIDTTQDIVYSPTTPEISDEAVSCLQTMIDNCRARNIALVITYAPEYRFRLQRSVTNFKKFIQVVNNITRKNTIPFYRDDQLSMCTVPCWFANYGHVNTEGAAVYSRLLGTRIAEWFNGKRKTPALELQ